MEGCSWRLAKLAEADAQFKGLLSESVSEGGFTIQVVVEAKKM